MILGIRLLMEKRYFQTEEIELRCVATFQKTIADFQEQVIIKTFNSEFLLGTRSSSSATAVTKTIRKSDQQHWWWLIIIATVALC